MKFIRIVCFFRIVSDDEEDDEEEEIDEKTKKELQNFIAEPGDEVNPERLLLLLLFILCLFFSRKRMKI